MTSPCGRIEQKTEAPDEPVKFNEGIRNFIPSAIILLERFPTAESGFKDRRSNEDIK
jgi:hypothetical protein